MNIAILGANGHIAKAIKFCLDGLDVRFFLFSRENKENRNADSNKYYCSYKDFQTFTYEAIFNCIGLTPAESDGCRSRLFETTEHYDQMVINRLKNNPTTKYINISSGIAYGQDFDEPASEGKKACLKVNDLSDGDLQCLNKLYTEAKHRSYDKLNIIDLRIFGFFTRFIDLRYKFLLTEILNCLMGNRTFVTDNLDIARDYIHLSDFKNLLTAILNHEQLNTSIDARSAHPVKKLEILRFFEEKHKLEYHVTEEDCVTSITGAKPHYYSMNGEVLTGYVPVFSSLECIEMESDVILENTGKRFPVHKGTSLS